LPYVSTDLIVGQTSLKERPEHFDVSASDLHQLADEF
jgi:hypothetical protein